MAEAARETALWVIGRLREAGYQALLAGGCVRDMLLGHASTDYDVATDARPEQVRGLFGKVLLVGAQFGVAIVLRRGQKVEVATFRSDLDYADGRRPRGVVYSTPEQDAHRRDFTINGMFYDPLTDEVIDYVGGREDLDRRVIRTIGRPDDRFGEDYLRMLRAVRFTTRLGFDLEPATADAIRRHARRITAISGERICDELSKMLKGPSAPEAMRYLDDLRLLEHVLPELYEPRQRWSRAVERLACVAEQGDLPLSLAAMLGELPPGQIRRIARRWGAPNDLAEAVAWLAEHLNDWPTAADLRLAHFKALLASEHFPKLLKLWECAEARQDPHAPRTAAARSRALEIPPDRISPPPLVSGEDLKRLGLSQGQRLGRIHRLLYLEQLDEHLSSRPEALARARQLVDQKEDPVDS